MARKININRPEISSAEIEAGKNFNKLLSSQQAAVKSFYKSKWFATGLAAVTFAVLLTVGYLQWNATSELFINPPIAGVDIPNDNFKFNGNEAQQIVTENGSRIYIPANAFVRDDGKAVGIIDLYYREFHDPVDFYISGIPMTYDSAGKEYTFESAGMFEMRAYDNGKELQLDSGKEIVVELFSKIKVGNYNVYYLDEDKENWENKGVDSIIVTPEPNQIVEADSESDTLADESFKFAMAPSLTTTPVKPIKPKTSNPDNYTFDIEVNAAEFPEIAGYMGMLFEVDPGETRFSANVYEVVWDDVILKSSSEKGKYRMVLKKGKTEHEFLVYPVLEGKDLDKSMALYEAKFKAYEIKLAERKAEEVERERLYQIHLTAVKRKKEQAKTAYENIANINRRLSVSKMGYWNCDQPNSLPKGGKFTAKLVDENNNEVIINTLKMVDKSRNMVYSFYNNFNSKTINVSYNPDSDNVFFGTDNYGRLVIVKKDEFDRLKPTGNVTLKVDVIEEKLTTAADIKKYIGV